MIHPQADEAASLLEESQDALEAWRIKPGQWRMLGAVAGARGGLLRPVLQIGDATWTLRRQAPDITQDDTRFRHAFMSHLRDDGLPVPALLPTPDGRTWATAGDGLYELQAYLPGDTFAMNDSAARLESAASTLGALHQSSATFVWAKSTWPEERSASALAYSYSGLVRQAATKFWTGSSIAGELMRLADECDERIPAAAQALSLTPAPPELHIHGDFQPHNVAYEGESVAALYDFDAARWERRVYELAYGLLFFTGLRWIADEPVTPPRVDDGLDTIYAHRFLAAYGREAPPGEDEATLLADALALAFPIALVNGVAEDFVFADEFDGAPDEVGARSRLAWASGFWPWLDRYRDTLAEAWENG